MFMKKGGIMFRKRLKLLRERKGLTQEELGKKLHLGKSSISMYERGDRVPNHDILVNISNLFDVSIDYLLGKTEIKKYTEPFEDKIEKQIFIKLKKINPKQKKILLDISNIIFPDDEV